MTRLMGILVVVVVVVVGGDALDGGGGEETASRREAADDRDYDNMGVFQFDGKMWMSVGLLTFFASLGVFYFYKICTDHCLRGCRCVLCAGEYTILDELGEGAFGRVFLAAATTTTGSKSRHHRFLLAPSEASPFWKRKRRLTEMKQKLNSNSNEVIRERRRRQIGMDDQRDDDQGINHRRRADDDDVQDDNVRENDDDGEQLLVVIKMIAVDDITAAAAHSLEARKLRSIKHPNILWYVDDFMHREYSWQRRRSCGAAAFEKQTFFMIVTEHCTNGDLYDRTLDPASRRKLVTFERIAIWFYEICRAVAWIHDRNIIHRDIKLQNIFLADDGSVRLGDFGLAATASSTAVTTPSPSSLRVPSAAPRRRFFANQLSVPTTEAVTPTARPSSWWVAKRLSARLLGGRRRRMMTSGSASTLMSTSPMTALRCAENSIGSALSRRARARVTESCHSAESPMGDGWPHQHAEEETRSDKQNGSESGREKKKEEKDATKVKSGCRMLTPASSSTNIKSRDEVDKDESDDEQLSRRNSDASDRRQVASSDDGWAIDWSTSRGDGTSAVGTECYWAPEVARQATNTKASDMWSLGCLLLELSSGVPLCAMGRALHMIADEEGSRGLQAAVAELLAAPSAVQLPLKYRKLIHKLLSIDAERRPTAHRVAAAKFIKRRRRTTELDIFDDDDDAD